ncbi:futalosine hydrolase [Brevibacillus centrosporus]|uniref:futalosine hydrolase n=1 Tax=Brevibacillus centrosporus TaxID=54910 RepID=UPI002E239DEE|nr:futalosine hydrolase [Brevibacillus centrosporus]MED1950373.1 futalosine hydrolase [Brevibacillus centrosporus]
MEDSRKKRRVLVVTSVEPEREAILRGLGNDGRFTVRIGGVGPIAAAARTARILAIEEPFDLVICAGISGGFIGQAEVGSLVVGSEIVCADLGAETAEGFCSLDELGFGSAHVPVDQQLAASVTEALQAAKLPVKMAPILTLSTVTGTAQTAAELARRMPDAAAEAMEGYGVAVAAQDAGIPVLEIRAVSNAIGPRDKSAWRMKEAFAALEAASSVLREVL